MRNALLGSLLALCAAKASAYPVDGYPYSGIRRLEFTRMIHDAKLVGRMQQPGQYLRLDQVQPGWHATDGKALPPLDAALSAEITALLPSSTRDRFAVAMVDLSDPANPVYGAHNPQMQANVGSVGKLVVALTLFQTLADLYPNDIAARERVLRDTQVTADAFSQHDSHDVPIYDIATQVKSSRALVVGDRGSLWEFLDWMLSASSNGAASMVQKELIALSHFGARYPVPAEEEAAFFAKASRQELGAIMAQAMNGALQRNGLDPARMRQGTLFTGGGKKRVDGTTSFATPEQLLRYLFRLEAGTLVDAFSSREIKRLMYTTQRRIRYASHPALNDAAVYFKSGSLYQCFDRARGCAKYKGDKTNRLASVAIVESPAGAPLHRYLVVVMSNVLRENSAVAHQTLALRIQRLVQARHPSGEPVAEQPFPETPVDDPDEAPVDGDSGQ